MPQSCRYLYFTSGSLLRCSQMSSPTGSAFPGLPADRHGREDEANDVVDALAFAHASENGRTVAAHELGIAIHDFKGRADVGRKVDLVDDKQIGL